MGVLVLPFAPGLLSPVFVVEDVRSTRTDDLLSIPGCGVGSYPVQDVPFSALREVSLCPSIKLSEVK